MGRNVKFIDIDILRERGERGYGIVYYRILEHFFFLRWLLTALFIVATLKATQNVTWLFN